jgi:hypothetical protein
MRYDCMALKKIFSFTFTNDGHLCCFFRVLILKIFFNVYSFCEFCHSKQNTFE